MNLNASSTTVIRFLTVALACLVVLVSHSQAQAQVICGPSHAMCRGYNTHQMFLQYLYIQAGEDWEIRTDNLTPLNLSGDLTDPDPLVVVAFLTDDNPPWVPTAGTVSTFEPQIVAWSDDNGIDINSEVVFTAQQTGYYQVFLFSRGPEFGGRADLIMVPPTGPDIVATQAVFGSHADARHVKRFDTLLLGKSPDPTDPLDAVEPAFADGHILMLQLSEQELAEGCMEQCEGESCTGACERKALWSDNDIGQLARIDVVSGGSTEAGGTGADNMIVVTGGMLSADRMMTSRLIHLRRHYDQDGLWTGSAQFDEDGDDLTGEAEDELHTCDEPWMGTATSWVYKDDTKWSCAAFRDWIDAPQNCAKPWAQCWDATDSDHDGISDFEEVYGARRCFPTAPSGPLNLLTGDCEDADANGWCDNDCTSGAFTTEVPVSNLDATMDDLWRPPDPHIHDILLDVQAMKTYPGAVPAGPLSRTTALSDAEWMSVIWAFESEPLECRHCAKDHGPDPATDFAPNAVLCSNPALYCPNDPRYMMRLHPFVTERYVPYLHNDRGRPPTPTELLERLRPHQTMDLGGALIAQSHWNAWTSADRRHSKLFLGGLVANMSGGGQASNRGVFAVGRNGRSFAHELGHEHTLKHGGATHTPNFRINHPSLMNYVARHPYKDPNWFLPEPCNAGICGDDEQCVAVGWGAPICVPKCAGGGDSQTEPWSGGVKIYSPDVSPDVAWPIRFSRGAYGFSIDEGGLYLEFDYPMGWPRDLACMSGFYTAIRDEVVARYHNPVTGTPRISCGAGLCDIDLDQNDVLGLTTPFDLNNVTNPEELGGPWTDHDDLQRMMRYGKQYLPHSERYLGFQESALYYSAFNATEDLLAASGNCTSGACQSSRNADNVLPYAVPVTAPLVTFPQGPVNGVADLSDGPLTLIGNGAFDVIQNETREWTIQFWATPDANTPQLQYVGLMDSQVIYVILERQAGDLWYMWPVVNDAGTWKVADLIQLQSWEAGDWRLFSLSFELTNSITKAGNIWYQISENVDPLTSSRNGYQVPVDEEGGLAITFPVTGPMGDIVIGKAKPPGRFTGLIDDLAVTSVPTHY